jgi:[ribosomal protein S18]-alanine N-acetyltransferase
VSALLQRTPLLPIAQQDVDAILAVEQAAYPFPWSRANFIDSLAVGHVCRMLCDPRGAVLGYFILAQGVDEMHLLNLTVAPAAQGHGHGRFLLECLVPLCRQHAARTLWLEVRQGNQRAQRIYERFGFVAVGVRKGYYPAALGRREDAIQMRLTFPPGAADALE